MNEGRVPSIRARLQAALADEAVVAGDAEDDGSAVRLLLDDVDGVLANVDRVDAGLCRMAGVLAHRGVGDLERALRYLDSALAADDELVEAWIAKGVALTEARRYEEAISCFKRATQLRPDEAEAHYLHAVALVAMERWQEALDEVECAISMRPEQLPWWQTRLDLIGRLGDLERREQWYDAAADLIRASAEREAQLLQQLWSMDAADRVSVQLDRAALFVRLDRLDEAEKALQAAQVGEQCDEPLGQRAAAVRARIAAARGE